MQFFKDSIPLYWVKCYGAQLYQLAECATCYVVKIFTTILSVFVVRNSSVHCTLSLRSVENLEIWNAFMLHLSRVLLMFLKLMFRKLLVCIIFFSFLFLFFQDTNNNLSNMNLLGFITLICKGPFSVNSAPCLFIGMDDVLPNYSPYIPRIMKVGFYFGVD